MSSAERKEYECGECGAVFSSRDDLRKHIYDEHFDQDDRVNAAIEAAEKKLADRQD